MALSSVVTNKSQLSSTAISGMDAVPSVSSRVSVLVSNTTTLSNDELCKNHTDAHTKSSIVKKHALPPKPGGKHTSNVIVTSEVIAMGSNNNRSSVTYVPDTSHHCSRTIHTTIDSDKTSSELSDYIEEVHNIRLSIPPGGHVMPNNHPLASSNFGDMERNRSLAAEGNCASAMGSEDDLSKTSDEGELEAGWLKEAGFADVVNHVVEGKPLDDRFFLNATLTLTQKQADAVRRRVATLRATTLNKKTKKTDIRKVDFNHQTSDTSNNNSSHNLDTTLHASCHQEVVAVPFSKPHRQQSIFKARGGYSLGGGTDALPIRASSTPQPPSPSNESGSYSFTLDETGHGTETSSPAGTKLPSVHVYQPRQGITAITDIGRGDISLLRRFSLMEFTALCDEHDVVYSRRKAKKRYKDSGVFGVPLETLLENDHRRNKTLQVPKIFKELIDYLTAYGLEEEGILRVPGSTTRIKSIRQEIEERSNTSGLLLQYTSQRPNDVAGVLKLFLRELPIPLLTFQYLEAFAQIESIKSFNVQLNALNLLVLLLPDVHREVLKMLLKFLHDVVTVESNKMTLANVAMIMAPNLFLVGSPSRKQKSNSGPSIQMNGIDMFMATGTINIVRMLIQYQEVLWIVPSTLIDQVRKQTHNDNRKRSREKPIYKLLNRHKDKDNSKKELMALDVDTILVRAPDLPKMHTKVQLSSDTTAGEVVAKFRRAGVIPAHKTKLDKKMKKKVIDQTGHVSKEDGIFAGQNTFLYEVGGNIGERRLDHNVKMVTLLEINPKAEWIIKTRTQ